MEVRDELHRCDALVLSSRHETFGNVVVESLACGKPVVATRCGGPEDIISDSCGILVANEDVAALASGVRLMSQADWDPLRIRQHALDYFSPQRWSTSLHALYKDVIAAYAM